MRFPGGRESNCIWVGGYLSKGRVGHLTRWIAPWAALFLAVPMAAAQGSSAASQAKLIAHGKYLVTRVAMCGDCHSPHNERGRVIAGRELQGTQLDFRPLHPVPGWFAAAPPIAGLEGWTKAEAVQFLMTGLDRRNKHAGPPMPQFHMSRYDAEAVVAFLKSLHTGK